MSDGGWRMVLGRREQSESAKLMGDYRLIYGCCCRKIGVFKITDPLET